MQQHTCDYPLSLLLTQSRSVTHTWRYFSEHFFFESDAAMFVHGFVFAGAILISAMVGPDRGLA